MITDSVMKELRSTRNFPGIAKVLYSSRIRETFHVNISLTEIQLVHCEK